MIFKISVVREIIALNQRVPLQPSTADTMNSSLMMSNWGRYIGKKMIKPRQKFKPPHETTHWNIVKGDRVKVRPFDEFQIWK